MPIPARSLCLLGAVVLATATVGPARAKEPADLAGTWVLSFDKTGASCRVTLQAARSDNGDYFLGMPSACRHAMPGVAAVGRWSMPDDAHVTLDEPGGKALLLMAADGDGFSLAGPIGTYALRPLTSGRSAAGTTPVTAPVTAPSPTPAPSAAVEQVASRRIAEPPATAADLAGRYAVLREKRDTGCMLTLDKAHIKGGDRAQLAPGCRDQGIVVFDPSAWQLVHGELVLTARAGHKTKLEKQDDGGWVKDPKEGGKPLGLKKL